MKTKLLTALSVFILALAGFGIVPIKAYAAPSIQLSPTTASITNGASQIFTVTINTDGQAVAGSNATITFDPTKIEVLTVTNGGFFTDFYAPIDTANGRIEIRGGLVSLNETKSGAGTLATVTIKAKVGAGTTALSFACGGGSPTTDMLDANVTNILSCGSLNSSTITFSGGTPPNPTNTTAPNPTNTQIPSPSNTPVPTATSAPAQGIDPTCTGLSVSPSGGNKPLVVTLLCSGNDTDGDINGAEFTFGDGQSQLVTKNVGQFGAISTTHTYTTANTFNPTCRIRDNNFRFSTASSSCNRTIKVTTPTSSTTTTANTATTVIYITPAPTRVPTQIIVPTGPQKVQLSAYKPPVPDIEVPESEIMPEATDNGNAWIRYIIGGSVIVLSLAVGLFLIKIGRDHQRLHAAPPIIKE